MNNFDIVKFNGTEVDVVKLNGEVVWEKNSLSYRRVEYIESTGTQYIDTGILASSNTKCVVQYEMPNITEASAIFGVRSSYLNNMFGAVLNVTFNRGQYGSNIIVGDDSYPMLGEIVTIELGENYFKTEDVLYTSDEPTTLNSQYTLYLFMYNEANTVMYPFLGKILYFKAFEGDELICNFIPVVLTENIENGIVGEAGMWDLVTNTFFGNDGTGTFLAGSEI